MTPAETIAKMDEASSQAMAAIEAAVPGVQIALVAKSGSVAGTFHTFDTTVECLNVLLRSVAQLYVENFDSTPERVDDLVTGLRAYIARGVERREQARHA